MPLAGIASRSSPLPLLRREVIAHACSKCNKPMQGLQAGQRVPNTRWLQRRRGHQLRARACEGTPLGPAHPLVVTHGNPMCDCTLAFILGGRHPGVTDALVRPHRARRRQAGVAGAPRLNGPPGRSPALFQTAALATQAHAPAHGSRSSGRQARGDEAPTAQLPPPGCRSSSELMMLSFSVPASSGAARCCLKSCHQSARVSGMARMSLQGGGGSGKAARRVTHGTPWCGGEEGLWRARGHPPAQHPCLRAQLTAAWHPG